MGLKIIYDAIQISILKLRGFYLLNKAETLSFMSPYLVRYISGNSISLPQILNGEDENHVIFPQKTSDTDEVYIWEYQHPKKNVFFSRYGSLIIKHKVLCTDWNHNSFLRDIWKKDSRPVLKTPSVIALFSQYQDGVWYGGYYDFVFLVATKISRIIDAFPNGNISKMKISYRLFNAHYETEYLQLLGISPENLVDSSLNKVMAPRVITGNSARWHPNLSDILSLKQNIQKKFQPVKAASKNRIYVSRACRRKILNEEALIEMLKKFDFQVIEDKPRSVEEQITIYHNASFIIGPHGASFSNVIWCEPGAHLFELFSHNYAPDFFLYLAAVMDMKYSAYYEEDGERINYVDALSEDIYVSIPKLEKCLETLLKVS